ncbi:MAG: LTA synthase family protein [Tannerella sp.]|jgi:phosphoglycerol transferase MdoB-like AlkP superfamily enzyme|nr:LTA synthase family protein [Tannerella sp.]
MKRRILLYISVFVFFIFIFFIQKTAFILIHGYTNGGVSFSETLQILYHGLSLDMSMSGYLTIIPSLLLTISIFVKPSSLSRLFNGYFIVILILLSIITIVDIILYSYWGFHFDSSIFLYLQKPKEALASASALEIIAGILSSALFFILIYFIYAFTLKKLFIKLTSPRSKTMCSITLFLLIGLLFLPIRGGITVSTMNIGHAYFSERMFLNHAAINPAFNLFYSFSKSEDFASQYQFYASDDAIHVFEQLNKQPQNDSIPQLLNTNRPNIILFMLESFSYQAATDSVVAPNMHRFIKEGIMFDNFYANGIRTDRGIVSILSGYPSQPTAAILKYPQKTVNLPTIPKHLKSAGYENQSMYYGGDINFANMRSYFVGACGIQDITSDEDFPVKERLTKWGVPDKHLIERVYTDLIEEQQNSPFCKIVLTLSSHEPFDVPTNKFETPFLNSINYADECLGEFVSRLQASDLWENTLIIFIADHAMQKYPQGFSNNEKIRFHIPMIWIGGAVKQPAVISDLSSQNDLAATLLSQLNIDHTDFKFSKDILNPQSRKFAFYSYVNGFSMIDSTGTFTFDNDQEKIIEQTGSSGMEKDAKSFFQVMYLDLGSR